LTVFWGVTKYLEIHSPPPWRMENIGEKSLSERSEQILRKENLTKLDIFIECIRAVECLLTRKRLVIASLKLSTGV
jgi:hypothetical protein